MCVQNGYHGTKLFVFDGSVSIVKEEFNNVKEYRMRLFANHDIKKFENTSTLQVVIDGSTYQLCDKYGKSEQQDVFPTEITALVGKKYYVKKMLPVFTVLRLSVEPEIIESICPSATPTK
nr:hypothetical protein [Tanacetum cinerariifolium]